MTRHASLDSPHFYHRPNQNEFLPRSQSSINDTVRLPKKAELPVIPDTVPENMRPYLGQYSVPMQKQEIMVAYDDGHLAAHIPGLGVRVIEGPDAQGLWTANPGDDRFSFIMDDAGKVRTMIRIETVRNTKID
jgi:hypothetical protein